VPASHAPPTRVWQTVWQRLLQQSLEEPQPSPVFLHASHWLIPEMQRSVPQHSLVAVLQPALRGRQHEVGPPPSACRVSQAMEQQSSADAQPVLVLWQVA